ncbi:helix-turn-helix domain-containing protein [Mycolicibacterium sp. XJ1819]
MSERHDLHPDQVISPKEAAEILRVTSRTVQRYIKEGLLPASRLPGGRLWRIRRSDVEALLNAEASA